MRTIILIGFLFIADAIYATSCMDTPETPKALGWLVMVCVFMDIVGFISNPR